LNEGGDGMKRKALIGLVVALAFLGICSVNAQSGYKDYTWGMTVEQVRVKCPDLVSYNYVRWPATSYVTMYLYKDEIEGFVPNPLEYTSGQIVAYESAKNEIKFYFINKKLIAVEMQFIQKKILDDLIAQYGNVTPVGGVYGSYQYQTASWNDQKNRFIVWEAPRGYSIEIVTYIDGNWLSPLIDKAISAYRQEKASSKSRLD